ncbi:hypothetical protein KA005_27415, partial [bacterium]|nr:hypothetical protein [bacterium]
IATTRAANNILDKVGLGDIFHSVTCGIDSDTPKRYSAQTLANLIKKENLIFKETLFLDDSPEAVKYAMNAGIPSFLIHWKLIKVPSKLWSLDYLFITASNRLLKLA